MKRVKDLLVGMLIGALLFSGIPAIANTLKTFIATEARFPIMINGSPVRLKDLPVTIEGRTYLPLREIGNILGMEVNWNTEKQQVEVSKEGVKMIDTIPETEYSYVTIEGNEYINVLDVDKICSSQKYNLSWQGGTNKNQWYTLQHSHSSGISFDKLLETLNLTKTDVKDMTVEDIKLKHGLMIYSETLELFPEQSEFPYMAREEFENVVLPFINK